MRRILVDHARSREALRRGGRQQRVPLEEADTMTPAADSQEDDLIALDAALARFTQVHPRSAQVVELRFFGGMEMRDIAEVLQVNPSTVDRDWSFARVWLRRELSHEASGLSELFDRP